MTRIVRCIPSVAWHKGSIQLAVFFTAAATFLLVNVRTNTGSRGSGIVERLRSPSRRTLRPITTTMIHQQLNYTAAQWNAMLCHTTPARIRSFCDDVTETNQSLVPDCQASMVPELWIGQRKFNARLVLGMPTMWRPIKQYVRSTLKKILRSLPPADRNSTVILVLIVDQEPLAIEKVLIGLFEGFRSEIQSGLVEILVPNPRFYRTLSTAPCSQTSASHNGLLEIPCRNKYLRWRNKQNFDYAYLMAYGSQLGQYYLQMEDDMICHADLFPAVFGAIDNYDRAPWVLAEATDGGFRGKMFRSNDTFYLAQFILRHFNEMPCDWLYPIFVQNQPNPCEAERDRYPLAMDCRHGSRNLTLRDHTLCSHRGRFSSLKDKIVPIHLKTRDNF